MGRPGDMTRADSREQLPGYQVGTPYVRKADLKVRLYIPWELSG